MNITFYGAARTVTGSCHMVEACGKKFLVDCGMFQGKLVEQMLNYEDFPFDIKEIDFVILTHAHIDHSGRLPKLYKQGYNGVIYTTNATVDLCTIMLADSGHIQEKEIEWVNKKRRRAGKKESEPMYTAQDGSDSIKLFKGLEYNQTVVIDENISFKLIDAGHMLGSSIVLLDIKEDDTVKRLVFTGDLGNINMPLLNDPDTIDKADYLVIESTYGNRLHGEIKDQSAEFVDIILKTIERGGNLIIPSFAVGRTQEILYEINKYADLLGVEDKLRKIPVYVDSPLAVNATKIFEQNPEYYDEETLKYLLEGENPLNFENLHFIVSPEESKALNEDNIPKIIISASGMCEVGRIKHHLKHNLYRPESTVLFVGFQAEGTLGKRIMSGEKLVKIFGEEIAVKAEIRYLDSFSGHADKNGLLNWIDKIKEKPKNIFIVHGEYLNQQVFKNEIFNRFGINSIIPSLEETYTLDGKLIETKATYNSARFDILEELSFLKQDIDDVTNIVKTEIKHNIVEEDLQGIKEKLAEIGQAIANIKGTKTNQ
ncbi:MAG: MBL fold metallo-hydrolase [Clostridia bacterium]|nr:MBL fold metallo-hydrolase [Clostridia bacterium]MDD4386703.1 MBL fold metallo-hydrolase [Clostridia bacterium]